MTGIKLRVALVAILPLVAFIIAAGAHVLNKRAVVGEMEALIPFVDLAVDGGAAVHELQKERGASVGFISSGGSDKFAELVSRQRNLTDARLKALRQRIATKDWAALDGQIGRFLDDLKGLLARLGDHRAAVDARTVTVAENVRYYTSIITDLISVVGRMTQVARDREIANMLGAYRSLIQAKEMAGLERAIGARMFNVGAFRPSLYRAFVTKVANQEAFLREFDLLASERHRRLFAETVAGPEVDTALAWRRVLLDVAETGDFQGIDGSDWFARTTARIDRLKTVEDAIAGDLASLALATRDRAEREQWIVLAVAALLSVGLIALTVFLVLSITRPLGLATGVIREMADGNYEAEIPESLHRRDEIGQIAEALEVFKANTAEAERLKAEAAEAARRRQEEAEERARFMAERCAAFEERVSNLLEALAAASSQLDAAAETMSRTVERTSEQTTAVASASEEASANVQTVAAAAEELSTATHEISRQVAQSTEITLKAVREAEATGSTVETMEEAANKIGQVIELINDIADQTNLLALNATIEAARAGEAGKGFAVVANEVKSLANQTAKATEEIAAQISSVQATATDVVEAIRRIAGSVEEINEVAAMIASATEEQGATTEEIARNVQEAAAGTSEVSSNIIGIKEVSGEAERAANLVSEAAGALSAQSEDLRQAVQAFLDEIKAA